MFNKTAEYYDRFYKSIKDYADEAEQVHRIIQSNAPGARTVLDVACGPGRHLFELSSRFSYACAGIDLEPRFVDLASELVPNGKFKIGDMRSFDLEEEFDSVVCLFSAIGYVHSTEDLASALGCFRKHTKPGGVVVVEPWLRPDDFHPGRNILQTLQEEDLIVARLTRGTIDGNRSVFQMEYLIADAEGIRRETEIHELTLFSEEEMRDAFAASGLNCVFDPEGLTGRGLYVAKTGE